ncbi:MAG: hypothetical protein AAGC95_01445 [Pseudomonadota bacterium]
MTGGVRIDAGRDFTEIAKDLHAQFKKTDGKGGVRLDGQGLYVKNNSEFWDKHIALTNGRLKARFDKFDNAAHQLASAIDQEYRGITIGDQTIGDYVFDSFLTTDRTHRIDETMLTDFEEKLQEALSVALKAALSTGDQSTVDILSSRQDVLEAVKHHKNEAATVQYQMGWHEKVTGYNTLRDALAQDLHTNMRSAAQGRTLNEMIDEKPDLDLGQDSSLSEYLSLRPEAESILKKADVMHMGLTNASINKAMKAVADIHENSETYKSGNFKMLQGLYDKVRMNNAVDSEVSRIRELGAKAKDIAQKFYNSRDMEFDDYMAIDKALKDNMNTIASLKQCKADGLLYDEERAQMLSELLCDNSEALFEAISVYVNTLKQDASFHNDYSPSEEVMELLEALKKHTVKTYDLAKSLLPKGDRLDRSVGFRHAEGFMPEETEIHALMEASVRGGEVDGKTIEPFQRKLKMPESLYQSHPVKDDVLNPIDTHNENIELVKDMISIVETTQDPDYLFDLRVSLDSALQSYFLLSAYTQSKDESALGKSRLLADDDKLLLSDQGFLLQQISMGVDALIDIKQSEDQYYSDAGSVNQERSESAQIIDNDIDEMPDLPLSADKESNETVAEEAFKEVRKTFTPWIDHNRKDTQSKPNFD